MPPFSGIFIKEAPSFQATEEEEVVEVEEVDNQEEFLQDHLMEEQQHQHAEQNTHSNVIL